MGSTFRVVGLSFVLAAGCSTNSNNTDGTSGTSAQTSGAGATGTAGTGGTAGTTASTGTGPPVVVEKCDGLGAVDTFENVIPPDADLTTAGVTNVKVDPLHAGTVFVGTDHKGLLKSSDCGATWTKINTGTNGTILDSGTVWYFEIDPANSDVIFAAALYGSDTMLYKSTNGGVDWASTMPRGGNVATAVDFFQEASIDPTDHQHLVVSFHDNCKGTYPMCMAESHDAGATWTLLKGPTDSWTEDARPIVIGDKTWLYVAVEGGGYYTADSGGTWEKLPMGGGSHIYHASDGTYYMSTLYGTFRSPDAHAWSQIPMSPNGAAIVGDGKRVFVAERNTTAQPYHVSSETDGNTWTTYASPPMSQGAVVLDYDSSHHVMYSANTSAGLYRVVTQ